MLRFGLGLSIQSQGLAREVWGLGLEVGCWESGFRAWGLGSRVFNLGVQDSGFGLMLGSGLGHINFGAEI